MGLFGDPPVAGDLMSKLAGCDRRSRSRLAKAQDVIRSTLAAGEFPLLIAVDDLAPDVAVITNTRVFVVSRTKVTRSVTPDRIARTRLGRLPGNGFLAMIDGPGMVLKLATFEQANRFVTTIDSYLLGPGTGPRDIPELFPDFFSGILLATGKPTTPGNMVQIIDRVIRMIWAGSAMAYFDQAGDEAARGRFIAKFTSNDDDGDFQLRKPDLMIDFLWEWSPQCHQALRRVVPRIHEFLTSPDSFLWECGDQIPAWGEPE